MANLQTTYMGIALANPIIAGASELTGHIESVKKIEEAGAGALVIKSLFEEQIQLERFKLEEDATMYDHRHPEMINIHPRMEHAGPQEHLTHVKKVKETVKIPVIASLNCVNRETWLEYAKMLQDTGVDGLELNFYASPREQDEKGASIEDDQVAVAEAVVKAVSIPVSVKLSVFYSNPLQVISRFDQAGVKGFVLFNRMFQPDINVKEVKHISPFNLSNQIDNRLPLRFAGLLYGALNGDVCSSTGIFDGKDVIKMLLAGSTCVQVVSTLYRNKITQIQTMLKEIEEWMGDKGHTKLEDFRGQLSKKHTKNPWTYERAQYVRLLFDAENVIKNAPLI
ncbi:dihydroorotate dehydrogenase-like protein [candidate division KSB3 bacterium]|uniref:Dihydroorotate dehydrogenase-like protein n=1 Tax=candidate division KSB3 bacterium TaxID=2044937 RepID=A0A9D5JSR9_9BACT|nr:dihydroorotate dehydrogenase-like protein [candidate division KSB3 bacterium]MBD3323528.1 dihydroorotate dehydrogenase-like protein [candidate division KSB3 bacterium]